MTTTLTAHAIWRARLRWLEPTDGEAARAIRLVLAQGRQQAAKGYTLYQLGTRYVRVVNNTAVTVTVRGMKRNAHLRRKARRDTHERRRGGRP